MLEDQDMSVQEAAAVVQDARARARRELVISAPLVYAAWGLVWLLGLRSDVAVGARAAPLQWALGCLDRGGVRAGRFRGRGRPGHRQQGGCRHRRPVACDTAASSWRRRRPDT